MLKNHFINKLIYTVLFFNFCILQIVFADTVPISDSVSKIVTISAHVGPYVVPVVPPEPPLESNSTSSSGSTIIETPTIVNFSGSSNHQSTIYILQDSVMVISTPTFADGSFASTINLSTTNNYNFSIYAKDKSGKKTSTISIPIFIKKGVTVNISNIYLFFEDEEVVEVVPAPKLIPSIIPIESKDKCLMMIADFNCDNHVNLTDYTILSSWYRNENTPPKLIDLNDDGKITLIDFSIMMYHWTD